MSINRGLVAWFTMYLAACTFELEEELVDETGFPEPLETKEQGGESLRIPEIQDAIASTRVWYIGDRSNVTRVYLLVHGDGNTDYSSSTSSDRREMEELLPNGEGAIVAYPVSPSSHWPAFESGANGRKILRLFAELERLAGTDTVRFEQFALSGGGRVNHALLRLINEGYDTDAEVREFVDRHLRGIHDGDSLCYSITSMRENYIAAAERFAWVRFCFIHNTSGQMSYVHGHHNTIAKHFDAGQGYPFGGALSLQDGRLRFWSAPTHWEAWKGQFARVFFGAGDSVVSPGTTRRWIGGDCVDDGECTTSTCLTEGERGYPGGMCTERCERLCPDRIGEPLTFCVTLGDEGFCHSMSDMGRFPETGCRSGFHAERRNRHGDAGTTREVCLPDGTGRSDPTRVSVAGAGTPRSIPDADRGGITSTAQVTDVPDCGLRVAVDLSIRHSYRGDLVVGLTDPGGTRIVLHDRAGGATDDLVLTGTLVSTLLGRSGAIGTWSLDVSDQANLDVGVLESWRLEITCSE